MSSAEGTETTTETVTTETTSTEDGNTPSGTTSTAGDGWKPPTSQEELNHIIAERVRRAESKYADYKAVKTKATQYDAMVESQKTELEKIQDRAEAAEKRAADLEAAADKKAAEEAAAAEKRLADEAAAKQIAAWKTKIAADTGIPASALRGSTQQELLDHAQEIRALIPEPRRGGPYVPTEGRNNQPNVLDPKTQFQSIIQGLRGV